MKYNPKVIELLEKLSKERKGQNKFGTREPIYLIQKRKERAVNPQYDTIEIQRIKIPEISVDGFYPTFDDIKNGELRETPLPCEFVMDLENCDSIEEMFEMFSTYFSKDEIYYDAELIEAEYYWETVAYFLTEKDAKDYQQYQAHNLGITRLYVISPGYDNRGILAELLEALDEEDFILKTEE